MKIKASNKYGAIKTEVDGIKFDSKAEARRYKELKLLEKAGEIEDLELQVNFPLNVRGERLGHYRADFTYHNSGDVDLVVEDVKGMLTPLYRWKKKHMKAEYDIDILET